jgi:hypothetical protein
VSKAAFETVRGQIGKGGDQLIPVFLPPGPIYTRAQASERERSDIYKSNYLPMIRPFPRVAERFRKLRTAGLLCRKAVILMAR